MENIEYELDNIRLPVQETQEIQVRSLGVGNGNTLQYSCLENSMGRGTWWATYSPWGHKESNVTEYTHKHYGTKKYSFCGCDNGTVVVLFLKAFCYRYTRLY